MQLLGLCRCQGLVPDADSRPRATAQGDSTEPRHSPAACARVSCPGQPRYILAGALVSCDAVRVDADASTGSGHVGDGRGEDIPDAEYRAGGAVVSVAVGRRYIEHSGEWSSIGVSSTTV